MNDSRDFAAGVVENEKGSFEEAVHHREMVEGGQLDRPLARSELPEIRGLAVQADCDDLMQVGVHRHDLVTENRDVADPVGPGDRNGAEGRELVVRDPELRHTGGLVAHYEQVAVGCEGEPSWRRRCLGARELSTCLVNDHHGVRASEQADPATGSRCCDQPVGIGPQVFTGPILPVGAWREPTLRKPRVPWARAQRRL